MYDEVWLSSDVALGAPGDADSTIEVLDAANGFARLHAQRDVFEQDVLSVV